MRNILLDSLSLEDFRAVFRAHPPAALLPPESDPLWTSATKKHGLAPFLAEACRLAAQELHQLLPELTAELYADFALTGNRLHFEERYFERRRRLARAAMCTLIGTEPAMQRQFRESLCAKAMAIFAEESWALPAHVKNTTGKDPLTTDLFAAESANLFAELLTLFPDSLPADFADHVRRRLRTQFFENYLAQNPTWLTVTNNWNAVCHQGVLGAALALEADADLLAKMFVKAAQYLPHFLKGFTPDGATAEGPAYWSYGFGWFAELNAQLEKRTRGELSLFANNPLIPAIARFGPTVALANGNLVNFSDSAPTGGLRPSLVQYLAERLGDPALHISAGNFWHALAANPIHLDGERSDLFLLTRLLLRCPDHLPAATPLAPQETYLPGVAWLVTRSRDNHGHTWEFAAKAGHNGEHHNHNDIASFLLNIDGQRLLLEIGAPEYVKDFFLPATRYSFLAARSLGHSVPLINGFEQPPGSEFTGAVLEQQFSPKQISFTIDFTRAYPPQANLVRGIRRFRLDKAAGILHIADDFTLASACPVETALIVPESSRIEGRDALVTAGPTTLRIQPDPGTTLGQLQTHEYRTHDGAPAQIKRLVLLPEHSAQQIILGCRLQILE